ncbi:unnamed protein product [Prorocentrum cordatum]|uniref:C3H1-type domain-containing protein n=1 Tax=Prorocentrum cordatum TaxID=2364126 RepID=A0ABN9WX52_9DINO|nr:unnamed protein product [Polarella glacialis]
MLSMARATKSGQPRGVHRALRAGQRANAPDPSPLFHKTRLCKFFEVGACSKGEHCRFAHGSRDLAQNPDFTKTQYCPSVLAGAVCETGRACTFAHSKAELRPRVDSAGRHGEAPRGTPAAAAAAIAVPQAGAKSSEAPAAVPPGPAPPWQDPPPSSRAPEWGAQEAPPEAAAKGSPGALGAVLRCGGELLHAAGGLLDGEGSALSRQTTADGWASSAGPPSRQTTAQGGGGPSGGAGAPLDESCAAWSRRTKSPERSQAQQQQWRQGPGGVAWKSEDASAGVPWPRFGSEADADLAVEIRNTFVTLPDDEESARPLRRTQSLPALLRDR